MASISDIDFLPSIEYTARDYVTIKAALIKFVQAYFPNDHTDFLEGGLGSVLLELMATLGTNYRFILTDK